MASEIFGEDGERCVTSDADFWREFFFSVHYLKKWPLDDTVWAGCLVVGWVVGGRPLI